MAYAGRLQEWIPNPRRLRVLFAGVVIADSARSMLLRQHGFLPVNYLPEADLRPGVLEPSRHTTFSPYKGTATYFDVRVGGRVARASAWTYVSPSSGSPDTRGYVSFHWHAMDAWMEEDEVVSVHARDPYLRAETLRSSHHVVVCLGGEVVADTRRPVLLQETGLVTRYYVSPSDVHRDRFVKSRTCSMCPYKGRASYLSFLGDGVELRDVAWYYPAPFADVVKITDHICFWNERADTTIEVDGRAVPRLAVRQDEPGSELLYPSRRFFVVPRPEAMKDARPGGLQHDFARPNGRPEGPPDEMIDMEVERSGGR
ncbi:MAG: DUF427 domain-containing protein, partial [Acidimicrobiales bacterium]